jgi:hypothetical protein
MTSLKLGFLGGLGVSVVGWFIPTLEQAFACAVCGVPVDRTSDVFVASTIVLSLVPLIAMGGLVSYLWRQSSRSDRREDSLESSSSLVP